MGSEMCIRDSIPRVVALKLNAGHELLEDARARRALSLAIDRVGIATAITRFPEAGATQLFPPALDKWHDDKLKPLSQDVAAAKALLAELGFVADDDGILSRVGVRFSLQLRTFPDRPELPLIADEPTKELDAERRAKVIGLLASRPEQGGTLMAITHEASVARRLGGDIIVLKAGELVESGTTEKVLTNPRAAYTQLLLNAEPQVWSKRPAAKKENACLVHETSALAEATSA